MSWMISLLLLLNTLFNTVFGNTPDSLENVLRLTPTDTAKVMVYNRFARDLLTLNRLNQEYQQALQYAQQGLTLAEQTGFAKGEAESHRTIGNAYFFLNDYEHAINHYNEVIRIYAKLETVHDPNDMAQVYYNLGLVYRRQSRIFHSIDKTLKALSLWRQSKHYDRMLLAYRSIIQGYQSVDEFEFAEKYALESLSLALEIENRSEEASLYGMLASISIASGNMDAAEEYFRKSLNIYEELDDQLNVARIIHNIALNLYSDDDMEKSLDSFRKAIAIFEELTPTNHQLSALNINIANLYNRNNQLDSAQFYYERALSKAIISENAQTMAEAYRITGKFFMDIGNISRAEIDFQQAYDIALSRGLYLIRSNAVYGLSTISFQRENYKKAYEYLQKYQAINDSIISESNRRFVQQMSLQHEFEKDQLEEHEAIRWQLERQRQTVRLHQTVMVFIVFVFILTAILLAFIIRSHRQKNQANRELNRYKDTLEEMVKNKTYELTIAKEKAEESNRLKSAFLENMSHEIRTPLNGIVGFLQFINNSDLSPERRKEYIEIINGCSKQLVKIIDDIMDISKIEAHQMDILPAALQLNDMMKAIFTFFEMYMQNHNKEQIELILDDSKFIAPSLILVDSTRLKQIINNLLTNAVKFTEKGYIRFGYYLRDDRMLEFFVEDTGIGIPENQFELIFQQFHKLEHSNDRLYGGVGIGLSISCRLTQLMGGNISVQSTEGAGSTFIFTIPYNPCDVVNNQVT